MYSHPENDETTTLSRLKERVGNFAAERGWHGSRTPKNLSMAIAAEAAELMEHFLWEDGQEILKTDRDPQRVSAIAEEVADILIYVMEFCNVADIDLTAAVGAKLAKNAIRFPAGEDSGRRRHE
jgi:dCTP diphosphatase